LTKLLNKTNGIILALVLALTAVYLQVGTHEFITYDDPLYVYENSHVLSGLTLKNVAWAFKTMSVSNWHPLTWLSHMLDAQIFGLAPGGHHLMNVVLHAANSILLFLLLRKTTGALLRSAIVAALFALHPLHVESVAWVSERKDVLSALFWMLTLYFYAQYAEQQKSGAYLMALASYTLGLMAKPMLVTLPFVMLLLDYWPLSRTKHHYRQHEPVTPLPTPKRLLLEKVPFLVLAAALCVITLRAQSSSMSSLAVTSIPERIANALVSYCQYLNKMFWPSDLAVFYPFRESLPLWQPALALVLLGSMTVFVVLKRRNHSYLITGWLWYLLTLLPVIGVVRVGLQSMADRYSYIPLTGVFIILVWGTADLSMHLPRRNALLSILTAVLLTATSLATWRQVSYWKNSTTLFNHALESTRDNFMAHYNLGIVLEKEGDLEGALKRFDTVASIAPWYPDSYIHRGIYFARQGKTDQAAASYMKAIELNPDIATPHINLGIIMATGNRFNEAIEEFRRAILIDPDSSQAHYNLGAALHELQQWDAAIEHYYKALESNPELVDCHNNLGIALAEQGRIDEAITHFSIALRLEPGNPDITGNLERTARIKTGSSTLR
jgi:protein O-mannosyl-transferase